MLRSMFSSRITALAIVTTVLGAACGGSPPPATHHTEEPPPPPPPRGAVHLEGSDVHGVIGPAGGTITLSNGCRIDIPDGSIDADLEFHATEGAAANVWSSEEGEVEAGPLFDLRPFVVAESGHTFTISCPARDAPRGFESADVRLGMEEEMERRAFTDAVQTRWQYHPASREGDRFVAELAYFGGHRVQFGFIR